MKLTVFKVTFLPEKTCRPRSSGQNYGVLEYHTPEKKSYEEYSK